MNYEQPPTSHPYAKGFADDNVHREEVLEIHLCKALVEQQGYRPRAPEDFDRASALDKAMVLAFVKATQAVEWSKLEGQYGASSEAEFFKQLEQGLKQRGTLGVLRNGVKLVPNLKFVQHPQRHPTSSIFGQERKRHRCGALRQRLARRHAGTEEHVDRIELPPRRKAVSLRQVTCE
jgi:hypothetical protein